MKARTTGCARAATPSTVSTARPSTAAAGSRQPGHRLSIQKHGARAADAATTDEFGTGEVQPVAQHVNDGVVGSHRHVVSLPIDAHRHHGTPPLLDSVNSIYRHTARQESSLSGVWLSEMDDTGTVTASGTVDLGRAAMARRSWSDAFRHFSAADAAIPLEPDDLEQLALAAYLTGHGDASTQAWTRAHHEALRHNDPRRSARNAFLLGADLMFRGELAPAMGWFARAGRVLEGCDECAEQGWLLTWNSYGQMWGGDPAGAEPAFARSVAVGRRFGDPDLVTMARLGEGMCRMMQGDEASGMTLFDEVMTGVISGEVSPIHAGITYCTVIGACSEIFDLRRAKEWTAALTRWCDAQPDLVPFRGNCLVHRCELMQLQGAWGDAVSSRRAGVRQPRRSRSSGTRLGPPTTSSGSCSGCAAISRGRGELSQGQRGGAHP